MSVTASGPSGANDVKPAGRPGADAIVWLVAAIVVAASIVLRERLSWITEYPSDWTLPVSAWINVVMDWLVEHGRWLFRGIAWLMGWPMSWIQSLLEALPWTTSIAITTGLAYYSGGLRLALFTIAALIYIAATGYWLPSMNTLALVFMSIPLSAGVGLFVGIWVYRSRSRSSSCSVSDRRLPSSLPRSTRAPRWCETSPSDCGTCRSRSWSPA